MIMLFLRLHLFLSAGSHIQISYFTSSGRTTGLESPFQWAKPLGNGKYEP